VKYSGCRSRYRFRRFFVRIHVVDRAESGLVTVSSCLSLSARMVEPVTGRKKGMSIDESGKRRHLYTSINVINYN
jgi:hypothetical protein